MEKEIREKIAEEGINNQQLILDKYQELIDEQSKLIARQEDQIELNTYRNELMKMKELTMKYENENKFYTNIIYRIIKFHIQNLNVRNIILEILNLNEKSTIISQELEKTNYTNDETGRNKFYFTKGQLNELGQKLDLLENELKQYEI